jgi:dolichyl-phosphate-mannose-protein mannosyltransferase
MSESNI